MSFNITKQYEKWIFNFPQLNVISLHPSYSHTETFTEELFEIPMMKYSIIRNPLTHADMKILIPKKASSPLKIKLLKFRTN